VVLALALSSAAASGSARAGQPALFYVGFAKADITPTLPVRYLGGEGYKRVGTVLQSPLYARTIAISAAGANGKPTGSPIVISSVDSQGYFAGYQSGPAGAEVAGYGYDQIRAVAAKAAHIPAQNVVFSSTHSHTAPDTVGLWGGVGQAYFREFEAGTVRSVANAIAAMRPARLRRGQADGSAYTYNPFPTDAQYEQYSNPKRWPLYGALTTLQAVDASTGTPIVTLFDYGTHPDILEGSDMVSPDWPAWTINHIEQTTGGDGMFLAGVVGDEPVFPGGDTQPHTDAYLLQEAETYAGEIDGVVDAALAHSVPVTAGGVGAWAVRLQIPATNAVLLADVMVKLPQQVQDSQGLGHILRAWAPPYEEGPLLGTWTSAMRIGDGVLFNTPGETYSDVFFAARDQVRANWYLVSGLTDDQIGYIVMPADWPVVNAEDATGRALDIVGPATGSEIVAGLVVGAHMLGFPVSPKPQDLVADRDPVVQQMVECLGSNCRQYVPAPLPSP